MTKHRHWIGRSAVLSATLFSAGIAGGAAGPLEPKPAAPSGDASALVTSVQPAVVNITVEEVVKTSPLDGESPFEFFRNREDNQRGPSEHRMIGAGSGFIIDDKGHVVTNAHLVDEADTVQVKLADEREFKAKVLGKDERLDVSVLQIQGAKDLPHVALGSSKSLKVGERVLAIGNPFGLGGTVTSGIVSAKGRAIGAGPYDDFIQTDASINPGNSGGPLFDMRGQVVGMNTAINASGQGISFAIPSDAIHEVLPQLIEHGRVERGKLGVHIQEVDPALAKALGLSEPRGALTSELESGGPGERAGLRPGDVVVSIDNQPVVHAHDLPRMIATHPPGATVTLEVKRAGSTLQLPVKLGALKDEQKRKVQQREERAPTGPMGVELSDANGKGALVQRVSPRGPASGLLTTGDVIVEVERQPIRNAAEAAQKIQRAPAGKPVLLRVEREGGVVWVAIDRAGRSM